MVLEPETFNIGYLDPLGFLSEKPPPDQRLQQKLCNSGGGGISTNGCCGSQPLDIQRAHIGCIEVIDEATGSSDACRNP